MQYLILVCVFNKYIKLNNCCLKVTLKTFDYINLTSILNLLYFTMSIAPIVVSFTLYSSKYETKIIPPSRNFLIDQLSLF